MFNDIATCYWVKTYKKQFTTQYEYGQLHDAWLLVLSIKTKHYKLMPTYL